MTEGVIGLPVEHQNIFAILSLGIYTLVGLVHRFAVFADEFMNCIVLLSILQTSK